VNTLVRVTIGFAIVLILMGVGAYFAADPRSSTALIPAVIGVLLLATGFGTTNPKIGRMSGIASVVLVMLLAFGSIRGVISFANAIVNSEPVSLGMIVQVVVVVLSLLYLGFAFQHIRKRVKASKAEA